MPGSISVGRTIASFSREKILTSVKTETWLDSRFALVELLHLLTD